MLAYNHIIFADYSLHITLRDSLQLNIAVFS